VATPTQAVIGLGANLGDPIQQLLNARQCLQQMAINEAVYCSSFYLSSPVGYDDQPHFVNAVVAFQTQLAAHELLNQLQAVENKLGRVRDPNNQNAARSIDLDILFYGEHQINDDRLIVPHPRMGQRLFALVPLAELSPTHLPKIAADQRNEVKTLIENIGSNSQFQVQELIKLSL